MKWLLIVTLLSSACADPLAPSGAFTYPPELRPVIAYLDADTWIHPLIGEPTGQWMRRHIAAIEWSDQAAPNVALAHYASGRVLWNPAMTPDTQGIAIMASSLIHEARHLQGYQHTCGHRDRTFEEGGAFAVQILWLEQQGLMAEASSLRRQGIGC